MLYRVLFYVPYLYKVVYQELEFQKFKTTFFLISLLTFDAPDLCGVLGFSFEEYVNLNLELYLSGTKGY